MANDGARHLTLGVGGCKQGDNTREIHVVMN